MAANLSPEPEHAPLFGAEAKRAREALATLGTIVIAIEAMRAADIDAMARGATDTARAGTMIDLFRCLHGLCCETLRLSDAASARN